MKKITIEGELTDVDAPSAPGISTKVIFENGNIEIMPKGHGSKDTVAGTAGPIYIENLDGEIVLYVWADINDSDPTHVINLSGARESNRNEDEDL